MFVNHGDICNIKGDSVEKVDCIIGGSPCQDLSIAGSKQGLSGSQSRLFLEQMRVVEEMRTSSNGTKPRYMIWENVTNSLSCNNGKDFQRVLMECINVAIRTSFCIEQTERKYTENSQTIRDKRQQSIPDVPMPKNGKWAKSGILYDDLGRWSIAWRIHDAQYWGVAQRRRRIALVVDFGGLTSPEVLFERKSSTRNINKSNTQRQATSRCFSECIEESNRESNQIKNNNNVFTYDARGNGDGDGKVTSTITGDHDNRITDYTNVIVEKEEPYLSESNQNHATITNNEVCSTLTVSMGMGGGYVPMITENKPICIGNGQSHITNHYTVDLSQTLNCMHDPMTILEPKNKHLVKASHENGCYDISLSDIDYTITCSGGKPCQSYPAVLENKIHTTYYFVRRLTPLECTRLQGFPDGWVDIGDWIDSKGKRHKEADSPKYKALGNSIALPFWKWLCKNIVNKIKEKNDYNYIPTMASLFAGIGGFDLCWYEATGTKESIKWVSEIEEFPIAVLKNHF